MRRLVLLTAVTMMLVTAGIAQIQDQDRVVSGCPGYSCSAQDISGTWLLTVQRGGQPVPPPVRIFITFGRDGTATASAAVATQSTHHGVWTRVSNRKFLVTTFLFQFDSAGTLANIVKARINAVLSPDGETLSGTQEIVVMTPEGLPVATIAGGTYSGIRLNPEKPGNFDEFLNQP